MTLPLPIPHERSKASQLAWGARVSTAFAQAVFGICREFVWWPQHACWLMACIAFETGATISPSVRNIASLSDMYMAILLPKYIGQPEDAVLDDDGNVLTPAIEAGSEVTQPCRPAGDRYSFRHDEFILFIARGFAARLDALEPA